MVHPRLSLKSQQQQSSLLFWVKFFLSLLLKHSLCFSLLLNACIYINHKVSSVVRVVGLLIALEMTILVSLGLWTGLALQTLIFWHNKNLIRVCSSLRATKWAYYDSNLKGKNFSDIGNMVVHGIYLCTYGIGYLKRWYTVLVKTLGVWDELVLLLLLLLLLLLGCAGCLGGWVHGVSKCREHLSTFTYKVT